MFPYFVNCGMEFLRVQDQRNMILSIWQKEDGMECFTQKSFVNNGVRIMVKGDGVKYQGDVVDKEKSDGSMESIIQWDGDHPDEQVHNADASFVRKTYRVYVNVDSIKTVCYDGKYDFNKKYVYTEWDEKGKLKSRGLVFGDLREVYPFKEFKDGIMTEYEYDYGVKSGAIDIETKKEIHRGAYVNSMKRGYPRNDNPEEVPSDGANEEESRESRSATDGNAGSNESIQPVNLRANPDGGNRGEESPIYYSSTNQENGDGERIDEMQSGNEWGTNSDYATRNQTGKPKDGAVEVIITLKDIQNRIKGVSCINMCECNEKCDLLFYDIPSLTQIFIKANSLNAINFLSVTRMDGLRQLSIDKNCCQKASCLLIIDCQQLESLTIGPNSFNSATSFKVMNCQNLKSITVGNDTEFSDNFMNCDELVLSSE